jgi:heme/copper-type cytochrome/quinol oxidase subunit 2
VLLAHAFGQRYDLPIPLLLFVLGGAAVVAVSFLLSARRPAGAGADAGPDTAAVTPVRPVWAGVGVTAAALLVVVGFVGTQEVSENLVPTVMWLLVWIMVPLSCGLAGDWTRVVNPFATLARLADHRGVRRALIGHAEPLRWPAWLGWWVAVGLLFVLACAELVFNLTATLPRVIAASVLLYAAVSAFLGLLFGPAWLARGEVFTVLFSTWGRLGWFRFGAPGHRGMGGGLDVSFERTPSRITFVLLLLISVNFDGLLATPQWAALERDLPWRIGELPGRLEAFRTVSFVVLALAVCAVFGAFAYAAARTGRHGRGFAGPLAGLLPSLLPIAFGYLLAHNLQYVLVNSQLLLPLVGNPVGLTGWPVHLPYPFNDDYDPSARFLPSAFYWYVAVVAIVAVHVLAVVLAHRHLTRAAPDERAARSSEYPWLVAMVAYTMFSLTLIAQPLVRDSSGPATDAAYAGRPTAVTDRSSVANRYR